MSHSFLPGAEAEYLGAIQFYEEQRAGLGPALIGEFGRLSRSPHKGPTLVGSCIHPVSEELACPASPTRFSFER